MNKLSDPSRLFPRPNAVVLGGQVPTPVCMRALVPQPQAVRSRTVPGGTRGCARTHTDTDFHVSVPTNEGCGTVANLTGRLAPNDQRWIKPASSVS